MTVQRSPWLDVLLTLIGIAVVYGFAVLCLYMEASFR